MMRHRFSPPFTAPEPDLAQEPDLPALIAARICHDLISPLGAIGNGVELLQMFPTPSDGPEIELVRESVQQAQARIRLFRIAFGSFRPDQMIGVDELSGLLRDYAATARFDLSWTPVASTPKTTVRLALLTLLCLETALPYGGRVVVMESETCLELSARSNKLKREDGFWNALGGQSDWPNDLQAARVQFPLLRHAIAEQGMMLELRTADDGLDLRIIAAGPKG
jgi:histidine phosphotransferase ChpT